MVDLFLKQYKMLSFPFFLVTAVSQLVTDLQLFFQKIGSVTREASTWEWSPPPIHRPSPLIVSGDLCHLLYAALTASFPSFNILRIACDPLCYN